MSDKEIKKNRTKKLEDGEVIYPSSKSSITSIGPNETITFSSQPVEKLNNEIKSTKTIGQPSIHQTISNVSVQGSLSTETIKNSTKSSTANSPKDPKIHFGFQSNEFERLKNLELILENKADGIEKALLAKQSTALEALNSSLDKALKNIDDHKVETKDELKETRNSVLGTIALFAAFFTFVSVNVNIFTKAENVMQSIIFMLSFWLCIIGFISLFFLFLNKNKDTIIYKTTEFITTASCILLSAGLMFLLFNKSDSESYKKINDKLVKIQKENDTLKKENTALNEKINKNLKALDEQIFELRKNQYQLNQQ
ncbi:hypothetical protein C9E88_012730 [Acinetobacter cumulans]|uniref:hypothetical protein n=1 Tax=Acinetobacter cumulans TaxID=2136182 RepID=UPI000D139C4B|nr:hypothetical protein [Acinetobacter cumulans]QCO22286.1 hypothetical protein C9E88_012730 [Acinetobacter cumulans]